MGTLFDQPARNLRFTDDDSEVGFIVRLSKKYMISILEVVAILEYLEKKRSNTLKVDDADIKDEQLMGFGEILLEISQNFAALVNHITE